LRPLIPDTPATVALRATCRARKDLVVHRVGLANQLREHLKRVHPAAVGLFADLDSPSSLKFLQRFDSQDRADWLSPKRLAAWLSSVGYCGRVDPAVLHARLTAAPRGAIGDEGAAAAHITHALLTTLDTLVEQIKTLTAQIAEQLNTHTDAHIFTSLPRSGTVHQPAPLGHRPRRSTARRDRRLSLPIPDPRIPCLPRWRRPVHPTIRQNARGRIPLGLRQTTARRRH